MAKSENNEGGSFTFYMDPQTHKTKLLSQCVSSFRDEDDNTEQATTTAFAPLSSSMPPRQRRLGDFRSMLEMSEIGAAIFIFAKTTWRKPLVETKSYHHFGDTTRRGFLYITQNSTYDMALYYCGRSIRSNGRTSVVKTTWSKSF
jgi:hypothetical protein